MRKGKIKGNRNPSSFWGTGGTDVNFTKWDPSNDFVPAWAPLDQLTDNSGIKIVSGNKDDLLRGGNGNDLLISGKGSDRLTGGKGKDIFVLDKGKGRDIIQDFQDKQDRLGLTAGLKYKQLTITQQGKHALIKFGKDELALLKVVRVGQLSAADFITFRGSPELRFL